MSAVCVGSRKVPLRDIAHVSFRKARVELNDSSLDEITTALSGSALSVTAPQGSPTSDAHELSVSQARAAICVCIMSIMQLKKTVRREVVTYLADLLNADITPVLAMDSSSSKAYGLLGAVLGQGSCIQGGAKKSLGDALAAASIVPLKAVSPIEARALEATNSIILGVGACALFGLTSCVETAEAVAALSVEAAQASIEAFDDKFLEATGRSHRGTMTSATALRTLLTSYRAPAQATTGPAAAVAAACMNSIPFVHGSVRDVLPASLKTFVVEVNARACVEDAAAAAAASQPVVAALESAATSLRALRSSSITRLAALKPEAVAAVAGEEGQGQAAHLCFTVSCLVEQLRSALAAEADASVAILLTRRQAREAAQAAAAAQASTTSPAQNAAAEKAAAAEAAKFAEETKGMSADKIAKIEAKRAAKAAKAAEKARKKNENKVNKAEGGGGGAGGGAVAGLGTSELLGLLCPSSGSGCTPASLCGLMDPYNTAPTAFSTVVTDLVERLAHGGPRRLPKRAKGTRDFVPEQMRIREKVFGVIKGVFKRHGAVEIDTPVFELKETLTGKYGEDSKLIYDLADQGGELLALRYDLTVPFARFLALNNVGNIKRYHIARVYRRDQPAMTKGKYREFYQCDFDIAGQYGSMVPDAEAVSVCVEIIEQLKVGEFVVKLNHRRLLDAMLEIAGVPAEKFRPICSAIDKLDKEPWSEVRREMVEDKGLPEEVADRIAPFVELKGAPMELLDRLEREGLFGEHAGAKSALAELRLMFRYLGAMGSLGRCSFDLSLARGLDYYTGVIYETVLTGTNRVGSISGGGRYDNLVSMFSGQNTPCVGVSIGIERIFTILEEEARAAGTLGWSDVSVLVASVGGGMLEHRMEAAAALWASGLSAEFSQAESPKLTKQLSQALEQQIPYVVVIGEDELARGVVKVKDLAQRGEVEVPRTEMADHIRNLIAGGGACGVAAPAAAAGVPTKKGQDEKKALPALGLDDRFQLTTSARFATLELA